MLSIFHLLWIVPHAGSIGFMAAAMLRFLMEKFLYNEVTEEEDAYHAGDKITFEGAHYICIVPEGVACVWSPAEYPAYWEKQ